MELTYRQALELLTALRDQTAADAPDATARFIHHCLANITRSSSQFLQDLWVDFELGGRTGGFFVEFGAADGLWCSNSRFFEAHRGWTGILSEPARSWLPSLRRNRACFIDERCVWTQTGARLRFNEPQITLHATIDAFSASDMHAASREQGQRYDVETVSLNDLLAHWNAPRRIDYLSIDTEGSELDILGAFDFDRYDLRLITVEHNFTPQRQAIFDLLSAKGYVRRFEDLSSVDDWYVKRT